MPELTVVPERTTTHCSRCYRPLKNPKSVVRGMGPVCAKKATQEAVQMMFDHQFTFDLEETRPEKVYRFVRGSDDTGHVIVTDENGSRLLTHHVKHSPTGLEWGYGGSGPSDAARSILIDALGIAIKQKRNGQVDFLEAGEVDAFGSYHVFKFAHIASMPKDGGELPARTVIAWWQLHQAQANPDGMRAMGEVV